MSERMAQVKGYRPGYPETYESYPVTVAQASGDDDVHIEVRFTHDGREYGNAVRVSLSEGPDIVQLAEQYLLKGARKTLAELGALIWPPPLSDALAWGFKSEKSCPDYPFAGEK